VKAGDPGLGGLVHCFLSRADPPPSKNNLTLLMPPT
jgi:hypothetical protein